MDKRILILYNPVSGKNRGKKIAEKYAARLLQQGIAVEMRATHNDEQYTRLELENAAVDFAFSDIWITGGDGTIHQVVNIMPASLRHIPLSIIPAGSGNDFAKNLYPDFSENTIFTTALEGKTMLSDVWRCNERLFMHGVGIAFDGAVVEKINKRHFLLRGHLAYYYTVIKLILSYNERSFDITLDFPLERRRYFMITIGNSHTFGGGFKITPEARIDDGLLDICLISELPVMQRYLYMNRLDDGSHISLPFARYLKSDTVKIHAERRVPAHIDGELFYAQDFDIKPAGFKLVVRSGM